MNDLPFEKHPCVTREIDDEDNNFSCNDSSKEHSSFWRALRACVFTRGDADG
jgi:hypothetical protein